MIRHITHLVPTPQNITLAAGVLAGFLALGAAYAKPPAISAAGTAVDQPLLVELFTSEGCSSCPPADALLAQISRQRRDVIVLSEHVTYWNYLGWSDPFSTEISTDRQNEYARRFSLDGPYTPQMVVEGRRQFVGSDSAALRTALANESALPKVALAITATQDKAAGSLHVSAKAGTSPAAARLLAVLVQRQGHQQVLRGENGGRSLNHVSIAREFHEMAVAKVGLPVEGETLFNLPHGADIADYRIVVFLQQGAGGLVLAAASTE